jgi:hypothetical protein
MDEIQPPAAGVAKPKLLLHVCCAPCATYPLTVLQEFFTVTAYFYDPNIHPKSEYDKRLTEAKKYFAGKCELIAGEYDDARWYAATSGHADDPERGERCTICYQMRLRQTAEYAKKHGYDAWTAALTVSPQKDADRVNAIGLALQAATGVQYLPANWKKRGGTLRGVTLARAAGLARQDYCGCAYSLRDRQKQIKARQQETK